MTMEAKQASQQKIDIAIIGAGVAGVAAAYGASRLGASVLLIEKYAFLGGLASSAWVGTICGAYLRSKDKLDYGVGTFPKHFVEEVAKYGKTTAVKMPNGLAFLPTNPITMDAVARSFIRDVNIALLNHTTLYSVESRNDNLKTLSLLCYNELLTIEPKAVIDTSGEALVSRLASLPTHKVSQSQASSFSLVVTGIESDTDEANLSREIALSVMRSLPGIVASILPASLHSGRAVLKITRGRTPICAAEVVVEENSLREISKQVFSLLKGSVPSFKNLEILELTPQLGIRAGALPEGKTKLIKDEVLAGKSFADGVAQGCWPIERWMPNGSVDLLHLEKDYYQIPATCLESASCTNLWFAGRSFCADQEAIASARVIATALGTGYAAGQLAASHVLGINRDSAIDRIRSEQHLYA